MATCVVVADTDEVICCEKYTDHILKVVSFSAFRAPYWTGAIPPYPFTSPYLYQWRGMEG